MQIHNGQCLHSGDRHQHNLLLRLCGVEKKRNRMRENLVQSALPPIRLFECGREIEIKTNDRKWKEIIVIRTHIAAVTRHYAIWFHCDWIEHSLKNTHTFMHYNIDHFLCIANLLNCWLILFTLIEFFCKWFSKVWLSLCSDINVWNTINIIDWFFRKNVLFFVLSNG